MRYKFLEHTADVKFQATGNSLEKAFENSAYALKETMFGKLKVKSKIRKTFSIEAPTKNLEGVDYEKILYSFLEQFLFYLDAEDFIFSKVKVSLKSGSLTAEVWGDKTSRYKFTNDVKAVTYNQMFVRKEKGKFIVQVVLDV